MHVKAEKKSKWKHPRVCHDTSVLAQAKEYVIEQPDTRNAADSKAVKKRHGKLCRESYTPSYGQRWQTGAKQFESSVVLAINI